MPESKGNVLITGGVGFIGSHVAKVLHRNNFSPILYDNLSSGPIVNKLYGTFIEGDITDRNKVIKVLEEYNIVSVIHAAAFIEVGLSMVDPLSFYTNNMHGGVTILEAMRHTGVNNFVFSSTAAVYGIPDVIPVKEDAPKSPINPYGSSKLMLEEVLKDASHAHGIRSVSLRYFNACGSDADLEMGVNRDPIIHLIPNVVNSVIKDIPLVINGNDYNTHDGTCVRDYIHVSDLAEGHLQALNYLLDGGNTNVFNLGTGKGFSIMEIINSVERVTGKKVNYTFGERREGDPAELIADASRANSTLGFSTQHSHIDNIVKTTYEWEMRKISISNAKTVS